MLKLGTGIFPVVLALLLTLLAAPVLGNTCTRPDPADVVSIEPHDVAIEFRPLEDFDLLILRVAGPYGYAFEKTVGTRESIVFELSKETVDGCYSFEVRGTPLISGEIREILAKARDTGDMAVFYQLQRDGKLPEYARTQGGGFQVIEGRVVFDDKPEEKARVEKAPWVGGMSRLAPAVPTKDYLIYDDLIVDGSACVGFDCVNGFNFSFTTIAMSENNTRIKFDDTSTIASYPRNDWWLVANDTANGGPNRFSIEDCGEDSQGECTSPLRPFAVEATAPSSSLYVDDYGRIGLGTSIPYVEIHTVDGDTPTVRLDQDGSSGWTAQAWDLAGNETNFFIRDVTNGSKLSFRIQPSAPSNSLSIRSTGNVGLGTWSPSAALHLQRNDGSAQAYIEEQSATTAARTLLKLRNKGNTRIELNDSNDGSAWFVSNNNGSMNLSLSGTGGPEVAVDGSGNMVIEGTLTENSTASAKENFTTVDRREILEQALELPISTWNYIGEDPKVRHLGPVAEDFFAVFGFGGTDRGIAPRNLAAVALTAVQGLHAEVEARDAHIATLEERIAALEARLEALAPR